MHVVEEIERALVAQWSLFGRWPLGALHEEEGILWFENRIRHLPYNGVIRTRIPPSTDVRKVISRVHACLESRAVDFMWFDHPSARPADLGTRLPELGLTPVEVATGMSLELEQWQAPAIAGEVGVEEVADQRSLGEYTSLTLEYWEIGEQADRELVAELHRYWDPDRAPGARFLARVGGRAVGKAFLSFDGPPGVAAIYGMSVTRAMRGRGIARSLSAVMLERAAGQGCRRVVLHSTEMARGLYAGLGFRPRCEISVFATARLWSSEP